MSRRILTGIVGALLLSSTPQTQEYHRATRGWTTVENYVQQMFFDMHGSGSMVFRGTCRDTQQGRVVYSDELSHPPQGPFKNLGEAMTAVSALDPHVSWLRDADGLIRVNDDRLIGDVLQVRLKRVRFKRVVDATRAVEVVMSASEVTDYLQRNHIEQEILRTASVTPGRDLPELSDELREVTVAQALDRIIRFFPGLWVYGECSCGSVRRVTIRASSVGWPSGSLARSIVVQ